MREQKYSNNWKILKLYLITFQTILFNQVLPHLNFQKVYFK